MRKINILLLAISISVLVGCSSKDKVIMEENISKEGTLDKINNEEEVGVYII